MPLDLRYCSGHPPPWATPHSPASRAPASRPLPHPTTAPSGCSRSAGDSSAASTTPRDLPGLAHFRTLQWREKGARRRAAKVSSGVRGRARGGGPGVRAGECGGDGGGRIRELRRGAQLGGRGSVCFDERRLVGEDEKGGSMNRNWKLTEDIDQALEALDCSSGEGEVAEGRTGNKVFGVSACAWREVMIILHQNHASTRDRR